MSPGKRKRVTFAEEPVVVHYIPAPEPVEEGSEDDSGKEGSRFAGLLQDVYELSRASCYR